MSVLKLIHNQKLDSIIILGNVLAMVNDMKATYCTHKDGSVLLTPAFIIFISKQLSQVWSKSVLDVMFPQSILTE